MSYNISNLKSDLQGMMHGTSLNQVTGLYQLFNRAARQLIFDIDPQETKRITQIVTPVYDEVFNYGVPTDLKGNKVIDIFPQVQRTPSDVFLQRYNQDFDRLKQWTFQDNFTIKFDTAIKTIRIDAPNLNTGIVINSADTISGNGTWAATAPAQNLTQDNVNYPANSSSLKFDLAAGINPSTGILANSTFVQVDLSTHLNQSSIFLYVYLPTASAFSTIGLRWGSDASNYWSKNATTTNEGTVFQNGWNLIRFDWATATTIGSPSSSAVDYVQVNYTYDGSLQTGVRLSNIVSRLGVIMNMEYYSKFLFRDSSSGAFQETVTADSNIVNLDTETYNLLVYQVAALAAQQVQGADALYFDYNFFIGQYQDALMRYKAMYKSEVQKPQTSYYNKPNPGYGQYLSRRP